MKIQVTVDMEVNDLPESDARALARELVEARGLRVASTRLQTVRGEGKVFLPKAGKPGSTVTANGIAYIVWAEAEKGAVWAVKRDDPDGLYYWISGGWATPKHADGSRHSAHECGCQEAKAS